MAPREASVFGAIDMSNVNFKYDEMKLIKTGGGMQFRVSGPFQHYLKGRAYARVFIRVPDSLFYLNGRFLRVAYDNSTSDLFTCQGKEITLFFSSLDDIPICTPLDPHNYKHNKQNWTLSTVFFDVEFPSHLGSVEKFILSTISTLASNYTERSSCGANFAAWLKIHKSKLYARKTGVTGNKRKIYHDELARNLKNHLIRFFLKRQLNGMFLLMP